MKTIFLPLLAFTVFGISSAHAAIQGEWNGSGEWKFQGKVLSCPTIQFYYFENAKDLFRAVTFFRCDQWSTQLDRLTLQKTGTNLLRDHKVIGEFTENRYHWFEMVTRVTNREITIERTGNQLDYHEVIINPKGEVVSEIRARLFLRQ